jgi:hypothetical protein
MARWWAVLWCVCGVLLAAPAIAADPEPASTYTAPDDQLLAQRDADRFFADEERLRAELDAVKELERELAQLWDAPIVDRERQQSAADEIAEFLDELRAPQFWSAPEAARAKVVARSGELEHAADVLLREGSVVRPVAELVSGLEDTLPGTLRRELWRDLEAADDAYPRGLRDLSYRVLEDYASEPTDAQRRVEAWLSNEGAELSAWIVERGWAPAAAREALRPTIDARVGLELEGLQRELDETRARIPIVSEVLDRRSGLDDSTFTAIYGMMVLLGLIILMTIVTRAITGDRPVMADRTLVEYGGMSFLLLAVIILTTGQHIEAATIGPLLGTIAGYIFGKGTSGSGSGAPPPADAGERPPVTT